MGHITTLNEKEYDSQNGYRGFAPLLAQMINSHTTGIICSYKNPSIIYPLLLASFMLSAVPKPIIFAKGDAEIRVGKNFIQNGQYRPGIYFVSPSSYRSYTILWGPHLTNHNGCYVAANGKYFARIVSSRIEYTDFGANAKRTDQKVTADIRRSEDVIMIKVLPGLKADYVRAMSETNTKAIIFDLYHSGTLCTQPGPHSLSDAVHDITERGITCLSIMESDTNTDEPVPGEEYVTTAKARNVGLQIIKNITLEALYVKTMVLLGRGTEPKDLAVELRKPILNEFLR